MSADIEADPVVLAIEMRHLRDGVHELRISVDELGALVNSINLRLAEAKGGVRAYSALTATLIGAGVSLAVSLAASAMR